MTLLNKEMEWLEKAKDKDIPVATMRKKLQELDYREAKQTEMLEYYRDITVVKVKEETEAEKNYREEDEDEFQSDVDIYKHNPKDLNLWKRMGVKKWIKNTQKQIEIMKVLVIAMQEENAKIYKDFEKDKGKLESELLALKENLVDSIMDTREIFFLDNPETGEEATKENMMECEFDILVKYLDENRIKLEEVVNGKI